MIVLVGFMGAGKTTVGRELAGILGLPFIDIDERIEMSAFKPIPEIFAAEGEPRFRALERDAIADAIAGENAVVAVGGGALGDPRTRTALEWHDVVHLEVGFTEAMRRVGGTTNRPMLSKGDPRALFDERARYYKGLAKVTVATDGKKPEAIAREIAAALGLETQGSVHRVVVDASRRYEVIVGAGINAHAGDLLPDLPSAESAFVLTHPSLQSLAEPVVRSLMQRGLKAEILELPEGEGAKSLDEAGRLFARLAAAPAHRHDLVVGVGGGVVTDVAGFVASTYNRGMPVVHVPTTLLAQVDAAIGGKTGVNLAAGKNLVGTIYQPHAVLCDVEVLRTLPEVEFTSGLAEVAKYGFIQDPSLLDLLTERAPQLRQRDPDLLREIVYRSASIKARVVAMDEREGGLRAILNYGHTFGHAFEYASGYSLRHGHAVALGMMAAAYLAHELGRIEPEVVDRHRLVLEALNLPVRASFEFDVLESAWIRDKKYMGDVRFVLLAALGKTEAGLSAPRRSVTRALERLAS